MATVPDQIVADGNRASDREPNLMRFGLRHAFAFFSLATVLAALLARMGGYWSIIIGGSALLIAGHVFGTFLGTRLRDTSHEVQRWKARPGSQDPDWPVGGEEPARAAEMELPLVALASREKLVGWGILPLVVGTSIGALLGVVAIYAAAEPDLTSAGLVMGAISCGVIGSWATWFATNFYAVARQILRQASSKLAQDQSRP